ncbi:hypothetical protein D8M34_18470 [Microbacterium sp. HSID17254]|nr:hypothetical protein D8M34_18470 [Microbacterium sp. HSID17254]
MCGWWTILLVSPLRGARSRTVGAGRAGVFGPRRGQGVTQDLVGDRVQGRGQAVELGGEGGQDALAVQPA